MKTLAFILSMPSNNAWNGRFTGEKTLYVKFRRVSDDKVLGIIDQNFRYDFGDGWVANVHVQLVDSKTRQYMQRKSNGFMGYEWMIDSILQEGRIVSE